MPHKFCPTLTKPIPLEHSNITEDYDENSPTSFQHNIHTYLSGPHIILPDIPVPPPRVRPAQPPRVKMGGPSSNLISSCKKNHVPNFALSAQLQYFKEANTVTHQISGVAREYQHLV